MAKPRDRYIYCPDAFERGGTDMPTHGTLTLCIDDKPVGSGQIRTQPGDVAFTGDTIKEVIVNVSGEHDVDLEMEAIAMFARE